MSNKYVCLLSLLIMLLGANFATADGSDLLFPELRASLARVAPADLACEAYYEMGALEARNGRSKQAAECFALAWAKWEDAKIDSKKMLSIALLAKQLGSSDTKGGIAAIKKLSRSERHSVIHSVSNYCENWTIDSKESFLAFLYTEFEEAPTQKVMYCISLLLLECDRLNEAIAFAETHVLRGGGETSGTDAADKAGHFLAELLVDLIASKLLERGYYIRAWDISKRHMNLKRCDDFAVDIVKHSVMHGNESDAWKIAESIKVEESRQRAYATIASISARKGNFRSSAKLLPRLRADSLRAEVFAGVAVGLASQRRDSEARLWLAKAMELIHESPTQDIVRCDVAVSYAIAGDIANARLLMLQISHRDSRIGVMRAIAKHFASCGFVQQAIEEFYSAFKLIRLNYRDVARIKQQRELAEEAFASNVFIAGTRILNETHSDAIALEANAAGEVVELGKIGVMMSRHLGISAARRVFKDAIGRASQYPEHEYVCRLYRDIAISRATAGDISGANEWELSEVDAAKKMFIQLGILTQSLPFNTDCASPIRRRCFRIRRR